MRASLTRSSAGSRFYERAEIKDAMAYLSVISNPDDSVSLERIINVPKRGLGNTSVAKLQEYARGRGISCMVRSRRPMRPA